MKLYYALAAAALLAANPVLAQKTKSPQNVSIRRAPPGPSVGTKALRANFDTTRITLSLKDASAEDALTHLLDLSGFSYEFDNAFYPDTLTTEVIPVGGGPGSVTQQVIALDLPPRRVTLKLVNAPLPSALRSVCEALGVGWTTREGDGPPTILITRNAATVTRGDLLRQQGGMGGGFGGGGGLGGGGFGGRGNELGRDDRLENVKNGFARVSVEGKDKAVRDALIEVLKAAQVEYAFDEDVAQSPNITVSLTNVTLRTALDAVCESAGIGWIVENARDPRNSALMLVRVGKRYAPVSPR